jgi:hypothetical protein
MRGFSGVGVVLRFPGFHREFTGVGHPMGTQGRAAGCPGLQGVRCQVRAAGPDDRARLGVSRDLGKALRGARLVEHRSAHPVEDLHLTAQAIGEAETEDTVADDGSLSDVGGQANHRSGSIGWSVCAQASTNRSWRRGRLLSITLERVDSHLGAALRMASVEWGGPWSSKNIAIEMPKNRLIVGTPTQWKAAARAAGPPDRASVWRVETAARSAGLAC